MRAAASPRQPGRPPRSPYARARSAVSASVEPEAITLSPSCSARDLRRVRLVRTVLLQDRQRRHPVGPERAHGYTQERALGVHLHLLEREGEVPVRQREVDEVRHARAAREVRDPTSGHRVRRDHAVCACLGQLGLGPLGVRASHDEQTGVDRPGRQRDVDVVGVGVDGRDQAPGHLHAGKAQGCVIGGVALDHQVPVAPRTLEGYRVDVDDDEALTGVLELPRHRGPDPAVPADDVVVPQRGHRLLHPSRLPTAARGLADDGLGHDADGSKDDPDSGHREDHRPQPLREGRQLVDLAETHCRERDHRHVDRVRGRPAEQDDVAEAPDHGDGDHRRDPRSDVAATDRLVDAVQEAHRNRINPAG